ncbi:unnamed protein product [Calypogeia fissa]
MFRQNCGNSSNFDSVPQVIPRKVISSSSSFEISFRLNSIRREEDGEQQQAAVTPQLHSSSLRLWKAQLRRFNFSQVITRVENRD